MKEDADFCEGAEQRNLLYAALVLGRSQSASLKQVIAIWMFQVECCHRDNASQFRLVIEQSNQSKTGEIL